MLPRSSRLHEYNAQELSNTAWAYAKAGVKDEDFFLKIAAMARSKLRDYNAQNLTNTVDGRGRRTFVRSVTRGECVSSFQRAPFLRASERAMASLSSLEEVSAALPPLLLRPLHDCELLYLPAALASVCVRSSLASPLHYPLCLFVLFCP